jgi:hypothetical protein
LPENTKENKLSTPEDEEAKLLSELRRKELDEKAWQIVYSSQPANLKTYMVLADGETYTETKNCTMILVDSKLAELDGIDLDLEVAHVVKRGWYSKYVKILTKLG